MPLTNEIAQQMISASRAKARALGIAVSTAIVDAEGRLFAFERMEGASFLSIGAAQAKAFTGAALRRDGPELLQMDPMVFLSLSITEGRGLMAFGSVTIVREDGRVIAGIGCSGATDDQDGQCAHAARDAYRGASTT
jgi:uncharacterized protein GlcG (DUF336 family)